MGSSDGTIDWGTNSWFCWAVRNFRTNSVGSTGRLNSASFHLIGPADWALDVYNGGTVSSTITISGAAGQPDDHSHLAAWSGDDQYRTGRDQLRGSRSPAQRLGYGASTTWSLMNNVILSARCRPERLLQYLVTKDLPSRLGR
jgi:hypothetical protein